MKITIEITLGNDAMQTGNDAGDVLHRLARTIESERGTVGFNLHDGVIASARDRNGNRVAIATVEG